MKQQHFEEQHQALWQTFEKNLSGPRPKWRASKTLKQDYRDGKKQLPEHYTVLCRHLAIARSRQYSPRLIARLQWMVNAGHNKLYRAPRFSLQRLANFWLVDFPQTVRQHKGLFCLASVLFYAPLLISALLTFSQPELLAKMTNSKTAADVEFMYDPANKLIGRSEERQADSDILMFGYYIRNNTSIGFQTFAGGIFYGIGSAFFLLFNGVFIGAVMGHLTQLGFTETFYGFVAGHSAFELTAIVLSGTAGLILGAALIDPGSYTRLYALQLAARKAIVIMLGAAMMFFIAALLEGFWSATPYISFTIKVTIGLTLWVCVFSYLFFSGRRHGS